MSNVSFNKNGVVSASGDQIGKNLIHGTHLNEYYDRPASSSGAPTNILCGGSGGNGTFSITIDYNLPVGIYSYNVLNNTSGNRDFQQGEIPYISGNIYTASWWAKGNGTCLFRSWNITKSSQAIGKTFTLTSNWTFYYHTFTATDTMETDNCAFNLGVTGDSNIYICGMKLELGDRPTPWIPHEDDWGYPGNQFSFIETGNIMRIFDNHIETTEFIEC